MEQLNVTKLRIYLSNNTNFERNTLLTIFSLEI